MYLPWDASKAWLREAKNARRNRVEIVKALSHGQVSRRDLIKWGLITTGGLLAPVNGLSPFARSAYASSNVQTGAPPSPTYGAQPFTQPMPRFDVLTRNPVSALEPAPTAQANQTLQPVDPALGGGLGPIEGRPPGPVWAHQGFEQFPPRVAVEATQQGSRMNTTYNPRVPSSLNSGIDPKADRHPRFHPAMPDQSPYALWTFMGTFPPKLVQVRYGEPVLFRHHNRLPADATKNGGFGRHTISTREHNGHHSAENDGFSGAFFFPGQFYDYYWPMVLAGSSTTNPDATDLRAGSPDGRGGIAKVPGDWRETMSTHWLHDHMSGFTSQNVYKGNAATLNLYSALDRGNEELRDGVNLCLPSGSANDWGNLDYDVNLMLADKACDQHGQLYFDIFDFDGFIGDLMTVNLVYKPYFEVERRKYRFRILNASVARFFKLALSDASPMIQISNDGNLLPHPVSLKQLDEQGIGERYDVVIDFSRYKAGDKVWMVNLCEHHDGLEPAKDLPLRDALSGTSHDPCVGKVLEFRIVRDPARPDRSRVPDILIPNPELSRIPVARERTFVFGRRGAQPMNGVRSDAMNASFGRLSSPLRFGAREIWHLVNGDTGRDHLVHIHFEEGQILSRGGSLASVPAWERGRKDVYRLRPGERVTLTLQFRDWGGVLIEDFDDTVSEDGTMLWRWELDGAGKALLKLLPTPRPAPQGVTFVRPEGLVAAASRRRDG